MAFLSRRILVATLLIADSDKNFVVMKDGKVCKNMLHESVRIPA